MSRTGPSGKTSPASPLYRNPFRKASVTPSRIDQGVDYAGRPGDPVYALGNGVVQETFPLGGNSGWPGGGWVSYKLTDGPAAGQIVYVAEDFQPAVTAGQKVTPNTVIGHFGPGGSIETGWAGPPSKGDQTLAYYQGQSDFQSSDIGGWSTADGVTFSNLIASLGGPAGQMQAGGVHGSGGRVVQLTAATTPAGTGSQGGSGATGPGCLIASPGLKLFAVFGPTVGKGCVLSKSEARAIVGAGILMAGASLFLIATLILAGYGLRQSGAEKKAADLIGVVPVPQAQVAAAAVRQGPARAAGQSNRRSRAAAQRGLAAKQRQGAAARKRAAKQAGVNP